MKILRILALEIGKGSAKQINYIYFLFDSPKKQTQEAKCQVTIFCLSTERERVEQQALSKKNFTLK